ncbi:hypothetical protein [Devosia naphthalenivorans]|uniref:hypothetical protein n=1 Tax=Devosia naphthalenivorans TaxID=2082392 RepID=UPI000D36DD8A|nr:hypothetical protein [Devosia naphthalenivorans]
MKPANDNPESASVRFRVDPRMVPASKAARRLGLTLSEFSDKLPALMDAGLPRANPITGFYDLKAMDLWMDRASGLLPSPSTEIDPCEGFEERLARLG